MGHLAVVQLLVQANALKNAPCQVREGRGGDVGRRNVFVLFAGGYSKAAKSGDCQRGAEKGRWTVQCSTEGNRPDLPARQELGGS